MKVTLLLADAAQAVNNKLYILGGGWSIIAAGGQAPLSIALKVEVPWDQTNKPHKMHIELFNQDGEQVMVPSPVGEQPVVLESDFEVGRPPGMQAGTPIDLAMAVNMPPL